MKNKIQQQKTALKEKLHIKVVKFAFSLFLNFQILSLSFFEVNKKTHIRKNIYITYITILESYYYFFRFHHHPHHHHWFEIYNFNFFFFFNNNKKNFFLSNTTILFF